MLGMSDHIQLGLQSSAWTTGCCRKPPGLPCSLLALQGLAQRMCFGELGFSGLKQPWIKPLGDAVKTSIGLMALPLTWGFSHSQRCLTDPSFPWSQEGQRPICPGTGSRAHKEKFTGCLALPLPALGTPGLAGTPAQGACTGTHTDTESNSTALSYTTLLPRRIPSSSLYYLSH